ncbi:hypothetical protein LINPERPRIM_LOCUS7671 [Linum perenne]
MPGFEFQFLTLVLPTSFSWMSCFCGGWEMFFRQPWRQVGNSVKGW